MERLCGGKKKKKNKMAAGIQLKSQWDLLLEMEHQSSPSWWWLCLQGCSSECRAPEERWSGSAAAGEPPALPRVMCSPQHTSQAALLLTPQPLTLLHLLVIPGQRWSLSCRLAEEHPVGMLPGLWGCKSAWEGGLWWFFFF